MRGETSAAWAICSIVVAVKPEARELLVQITGGLNVPMQYVGRVTGDGKLRLGEIDASVEELREAYEGGLGAALGAVD